MQVRNVVQHSSFDLPDAAVSRPQSASSSGRDQVQQGRDAILCSRLKGHQAATTCALVTSDAGITAGLQSRDSDALLKAMNFLRGSSSSVRLDNWPLHCVHSFGLQRFSGRKSTRA